MIVKKPKRRDNVDHPIFLEIDQALSNIKNLEFDTLGKTDLFRIMLKEQFQIYKTEIQVFLSLNKTFKSSQDFNQKCKTLLLDIAIKYEKRWKELNVPDIVISKFNSLHKDRFDLLLSDINTISFYRINNNYEEGLFYVLTAVTFILKLGITNDSIKALRELNGDLDGLKFQGRQI